MYTNAATNSLLSEIYRISEAFTLNVLKYSQAIINENVELKTNISELSISIIRTDDDPYNTAIDL